MRSLTAIIICCLFIGCAQRIGDFTIVSTKNYEASKVYKQVPGRFTGTDNVFFFIIPWGQPNIKNAVDQALEQANGTYMTNAVLDATSAPFMMGYRITGDVYAPVTTGDLSDPTIEKFKLEARNGVKYLRSEKRSLVVD